MTNKDQRISSNQKPEFPTANRTQAQKQLELLGYKPEDKVYLRFFYPSDDPRKDGDKGRKADKINWQQIEQYQKEGRGAYFVINGGGHKNVDVTVGRAIFIEHDRLPKDVQRDLWKDLKLPEPTFQIDTGGKSIHSYWVFVKAIVAGKWYKLQTDLLEFGDGDRSIKNPSRVMRLAGCWHISHDEDGNPIYNQSKIISCSEKTYTYEELREIIPSQEKEQQQTFTSTATSQSSAPNTEKQSSSTKTSTKGDSSQGKQDEGSTKGRNAKADAKLPRHPDHITVPVSASVPLLQCCRKEVREWVATGVPKGCQRNDTSINVGLELIGVERYLQTIGQSYSDSAQQLFHEFCVRSQMTAAEEEERFKWCFDINATPSCPPDAIEACIRGWYWREVIKPQQPYQQADKQGMKTQQPHQQADKQGTKPQDSPNNEQPPKNTFIDLLHAVKKLLANFPQESLRHIALMELARNSGYPYREIELLARIIQREEDIDEETALAIVSLSTHLNLHQQRLDISKYLEKNFADKMIAAALAMPTAQEYLFNTLLSAVASRGGTGLRVVANPSGGYVQPLIFWTGNVAHSGQAKTPPNKSSSTPCLISKKKQKKNSPPSCMSIKKVPLTQNHRPENGMFSAILPCPPRSAFMGKTNEGCSNITMN